MITTVDLVFYIVMSGLFLVAIEVFSFISARLDLVCIGFVLVAGGLVGFFSGSFLLCLGVIICLGTGYLWFLRKRVRMWIQQVEKP